MTTDSTTTEEVASEALRASDIPWAGYPILTAGLSVMRREVPARTRLFQWLRYGLIRNRYELVVSTSKANEFVFAGAKNLEDLDEVWEAMEDSYSVIMLLITADKVDGGGRSEALLWQWREICQVYSGVTDGEVALVDEEREVETVDGAGSVSAGAAFEVFDVLFDEDHSVLIRTTDGDMISIPAPEMNPITKRKDGSGRTERGLHLYSKSARRYLTMIEGERE